MFPIPAIVLVLLVQNAQAGDRIVASIEPLAMVAREVLGPRTPVTTLLEPGQSLHGASLTPGQARAIREAALVVWLGAAAEPWLAPLIAQRSGPDLALLSLEGIRRIHGDATAHPGGRDPGGHGKTSLDPHLWLDPGNIERLGRALARRRGVDPAPFVTRLAATRAAVARRLAPARDRGYVSHHDPWRYFARAFSLRPALVASNAVTAGTSARALVTLARRMETEGVQCVLAEPDARRALLQRLCGEDCRLVAVDPLGRTLTEAGYTDFLHHLGERFRRCLQGPAGEAPATGQQHNPVSPAPDASRLLGPGSPSRNRG